MIPQALKSLHPINIANYQPRETMNAIDGRVAGAG